MNKWIKCSSQIPPNAQSGFYTIICAWWSPQRKIWSITPNNIGEKGLQDCDGELLSIDDGYWVLTHWQYLPSPPEHDE